MERRMSPLRGVGAMLAALLFLNACGGGGGDGGITNPPPPPPPAAVASVAVSLSSSTINVTQTSQASAELRDAQNNVLTGRTVTWTSSNSGVATVSATSGLVTGVAAGTANIIATSEGRTGQAQITVSAPVAPPQITGLTITQNGQPANLNQVAGTLNLSFDLDLPAGFNGVLTLRVDTAEFHRETITVPAARITPGGSAQPATITSRYTVDLQTSQSVITAVSQEELQSNPRIRNGNVAAILSVSPTGGQAVTQNINFTANNPPTAIGLYKFDGPTATGSDGKTYTGGDGRADVLFTTYGNEVINGFEVILTPHAAVYGRGGAAAEVVQFITRTDLNSFTLPKAAVERSDLTYILDKVTMNGVTIDPQVDYFGNATFTTDRNGDGFADTPQQGQGLTLPVDRIYVQYTPPSFNGWNTSPVRGSFSTNPFNLDNVGPKQSSTIGPVFTFLDRMTTVGGAARWPTYGWGANNGQLSARYEFRGGLDYNRVTDATRIDTLKTAYYAAPITDKVNLYTPQYRIGETFDLGESMGNRIYMGGVRLYDGRGNSSDFKLTTSAKNPWNIQGQLSQSFGIDEASFGFTKLRASLNLTAMPTESVWNQSAVDPSLCWFFPVTNSLVGLPLTGWLSGRGKKDGVWGLGAGIAFDQYQILPSTGSGTTGTATFFTGTSMQQIFSRTGGVSNQGLYEWEFKAADNAGRYIGDNLYPKAYKLLYDYTAPANAQITYNGTVTAGQPATGTLSGTDNWGIKQGWLGMRFNYPSSLFSGGQVYVPIGQIPVQAQNGIPVKSLSMPIAGTAPIGFWFFNPSSGVIDQGNFYRSNGASWQVMDYARNLSPISFFPFSNSAPIPTITNVSSVKASMSSTNWCPGTCAGGGQNIVDLIFNFLDPLASGPPGLSKAEWYGIPSSGGGVVYPLGTATTLTSVVEGTGRRLSYNLQFDAKTYCGPPGPMQVFVIGYNTGYYLKVNPFFSVNVQAPTRYSNDCLKLNF